MKNLIQALKYLGLGLLAISAVLSRARDDRRPDNIAATVIEAPEREPLERVVFVRVPAPETRRERAGEDCAPVVPVRWTSSCGSR